VTHFLLASGVAATVLCVVETRCRSGQASLVRLGSGLEVTPWHPIKGGDGTWVFPCEVSAGKDFLLFLIK
jgi:hypothetical protein